MNFDLIQKYAGNEPPYTVSFDSGSKGPHLVINALTHGDETCGLHAIARILPGFNAPQAGRVTFAFSNLHALAAPGGPKRYLQHDMNRLWGNDVTGTDAEIVRMKELRPLFFSADYVLDLHSLPDQDHPFAIATNSRKSRAFAGAMPVSDTLIMPEGLDRGLTLIEGQPFKDPATLQAAIVMECGHHQAPESISVAEASIWAALAWAKLIEAVPEPFRQQTRPNQRELTIYWELVAQHDGWRFARTFKPFERLSPNEIIARDGDTIIRSPDFDSFVILTRPCHKRGDEAMTLGVLAD